MIRQFTRMKGIELEDFRKKPHSYFHIIWQTNEEWSIRAIDIINSA